VRRHAKEAADLFNAEASRRQQLGVFGREAERLNRRAAFRDEGAPVVDCTGELVFQRLFKRVALFLLQPLLEGQNDAGAGAVSEGPGRAQVRG